MNERTTTLPRRLLDFTNDAIPTQRRLREDAVNGKFPAHQINGIWHYDPADVPVIAAAYRLRPKASAQATRSRKPSSALVAA